MINITKILLSISYKKCHDKYLFGHNNNYHGQSNYHGQVFLGPNLLQT